jgi:hypothetical protein
MLFDGIFRAEVPFWIDVYPVWLAEDDLAFLRIDCYAESGTVELLRLAPSDCNGALDQPVDPRCCERLWRLSRVFSGALDLAGAPAFSPDGEVVALAAQGPASGGATDGIWFFEASSGSLLGFVPTTAMANAFPAWYDAQGLVVRDLAWVGDRVLAYAEDSSSTAGWPRMNLYLVDPEEGTIAAVADYTGYEDRASFFERRADGQSGVLDVPLQAAVIGSGEGILTVHQDAEADDVELRLCRVSEAGLELRSRGEMATEPNAWRRGPAIVSMSQRETLLLLNRYLVRIQDVPEAIGADDQ